MVLEAMGYTVPEVAVYPAAGGDESDSLPPLSEHRTGS